MSVCASSPIVPLNLSIFRRPCPPRHHVGTIAIFSSHPFPVSRWSSHVCLASSDSDYHREESRWLREEQRWLREEQRWLREEQRWNSERESLLREISDLRLKIEALERLTSSPASFPPETLSKTTSLLHILKLKEASSSSDIVAEANPISVSIPDTASSAKPLVQRAAGEKRPEKSDKRKAMRFGAEGDDVRAMQEALLKLGFYSGEEDMEYSSFSSGTERAVKTWQASIGAIEDGVMTAELQEMLYAAQQVEYHGSLLNGPQSSTDSTLIEEDVANGAIASSTMEIVEVQQTVVNEGLRAEVEISKHRVFLLGENRWEEPSRLISNGKQPGGNKLRVSPTKCLTCRGEGRLMCTECDGTGEANVEPQFLEWVDDGSKCPYCEGLGYTICDLCEDKAVV